MKVIPESGSYLMSDYRVRTYERNTEIAKVSLQPGAHGWTRVNVSTRELYEKQKTENATKPRAKRA